MSVKVTKEIEFNTKNNNVQHFNWAICDCCDVYSNENLFSQKLPQKFNTKRQKLKATSLSFIQHQQFVRKKKSDKPYRT